MKKLLVMLACAVFATSSYALPSLVAGITIENQTSTQIKLYDFLGSCRPGNTNIPLMKEQELARIGTCGFDINYFSVITPLYQLIDPGKITQGSIVAYDAARDKKVQSYAYFDYVDINEHQPVGCHFLVKFIEDKVYNVSATPLDPNQNILCSYEQEDYYNIKFVLKSSQ